MTLKEILIILQKRLYVLSEQKKSAEASGDLERVIAVDVDLATTLDSINSIQKAVDAGESV